MLKNLLIIIIIPVFVFAQTDKIKVTGEYTYTYGDNESLLEAKSLCYTMAIRNAIESLTVYVESTASVDNYQLKNDLIQTIASGYIDNLKVEEETFEDRKVHYKIVGDVIPNEVKLLIKNRVEKNLNKKPDAIDENSLVEVLNISEQRNTITVIYKVLKKPKDFDDRFLSIYIDYFDNDGKPLNGNRSLINKNLYPGEIRTTEFSKNPRAKAYTIWLAKPGIAH